MALKNEYYGWYRCANRIRPRNLLSGRALANGNYAIQFLEITKCSLTFDEEKGHA